MVWITCLIKLCGNRVHNILAYLTFLLFTIHNLLPFDHCPYNALEIVLNARALYLAVTYMHTSEICVLTFVAFSCYKPPILTFFLSIANCSDPITPGNGTLEVHQCTTEIFLRCNPGFAPAGRMRAACENGRWNPDPSTLVCLGECQQHTIVKGCLPVLNVNTLGLLMELP